MHSRSNSVRSKVRSRSTGTRRPRSTRSSAARGRARDPRSRGSVWRREACPTYCAPWAFAALALARTDWTYPDTAGGGRALWHAIASATDYFEFYNLRVSEVALRTGDLERVERTRPRSKPTQRTNPCRGPIARRPGAADVVPLRASSLVQVPRCSRPRRCPGRAMDEPEEPALLTAIEAPVVPGRSYMSSP